MLVWTFDRFAPRTRHSFVALEGFNHLGVRFVVVQDQIDTDSPMCRAMFTIGATAVLECSLISERVIAGMQDAETWQKRPGRPATPQRVISEIEAHPTSTDPTIRQIQSKIVGRATRWIGGNVTKRARTAGPSA